MMNSVVKTKRFCVKCDKELIIVPPKCDDEQCPCQHVCPSCNGIGSVGFMGLPCTLCKGAGLIDW